MLDIILTLVTAACFFLGLRFRGQSAAPISTYEVDQSALNVLDFPNPKLTNPPHTDVRFSNMLKNFEKSETSAQQYLISQIVESVNSVKREEFSKAVETTFLSNRDFKALNGKNFNLEDDLPRRAGGSNLSTQEKRLYN